jgi:hypothetical protein
MIIKKSNIRILIRRNFNIRVIKKGKEVKREKEKKKKVKR